MAPAGVCMDSDTDEYTLSANTTGHLTLLTPTNPAAMDTPAYKNLLIKCPGSDAPQPIAQAARGLAAAVDPSASAASATAASTAATVSPRKRSSKRTTPH